MTRRSLSARSDYGCRGAWHHTRPRTASPSPCAISGSLDTEARERAAGEIVCRHEALRTVSVGATGLPLAGFHLPVPDRTAMRRDAGEEEARRVPVNRPARAGRVRNVGGHATVD